MENEIKNMAAELKSEIYAAIEKANSGKITDEQLNQKLEQISEKVSKSLKENEIQELKNQLVEMEKKRVELLGIVKEQGEQLNQKQTRSQIEKSFADLISEELNKADLVDAEIVNNDGDRRRPIKGIKKPDFRGHIEINMGAKAAIDMTTPLVLSTDADRITVEVDPMGSFLPLSNNRHVDQIFPSRKVNERYLELIVEYDEWDGSGTKTEGSASGQSSFKLKAVRYPVFFVDHHYIITEEMINDVDVAVAEIARRGAELLLGKLDDKVLAVGADDDSDMKGLFHADKSTQIDFLNTQTTYAETIDDPSIIDVASSVASVISDANFNANILILNNADINALTAKKNADGDSVMDRRVVYGANGVPTMVAGLMLFKNNEMAVNTMLVAQSDQVILGKRKEITIDFWYNGDGFKNRELTYRIGMRVALGIRNKAGIAYVDDIAQAISDLTISIPS